MFVSSQKPPIPIPNTRLPVIKKKTCEKFSENGVSCTNSGECQARNSYSLCLDVPEYPKQNKQVKACRTSMHSFIEVNHCRDCEHYITQEFVGVINYTCVHNSKKEIDYCTFHCLIHNEVEQEEQDKRQVTKLDKTIIDKAKEAAKIRNATIIETNKKNKHNQYTHKPNIITRNSTKHPNIPGTNISCYNFPYNNMNCTGNENMCLLNNHKQCNPFSFGTFDGFFCNNIQDIGISDCSYCQKVPLAWASIVKSVCSTYMIDEEYNYHVCTFQCLFDNKKK